RFFFQAEDGIRDCHVTGVQTCALPILALAQELTADAGVAAVPVVLLLPADHRVPVDALESAGVQRCLRKPVAYARLREAVASARSEERRVGEETGCRRCEEQQEQSAAR